MPRLDRPSVSAEPPRARSDRLRRWIRDEFGSPADFFLALDANKQGKAV